MASISDQFGGNEKDKDEEEDERVGEDGEGEEERETTPAWEREGGGGAYLRADRLLE